MSTAHPYEDAAAAQALVAARGDGHRYRDLFRVNPDPLVVTCRSGKVLEANLAARDLFGEGISDGGTLLSDFVHPDDRAMLGTLLAELTHEPQRARLRLRTRTGRMARAGVRGALSQDPAEVLWMVRVERASSPDIPLPPAPSGVVTRLAAREMTMLAAALEASKQELVVERMARETAQSQERVRRWTMAVVAHGLRHPIDHVKRWAEAIETGGEATRAIGLGVLRRSAALQAELRVDLVDELRASSTLLRGSFVLVDVAAIARDVQSSFAPQAKDRDVALTCTVAPGLTILGDGARLALALSSLVSVALPLARSGSALVLGHERRADHVDLTLQWTGEPLRADTLSWTLERLDEVGGSDEIGMSCFVARHWIELHRGRLRAQAGLRDGGVLVASFPAASPPSTSIAAAHPVPAHRR